MGNSKVHLTICKLESEASMDGNMTSYGQQPAWCWGKIILSDGLWAWKLCMFIWFIL